MKRVFKVNFTDLFKVYLKFLTLAGQNQLKVFRYTGLMLLTLTIWYKKIFNLNYRLFVRIIIAVSKKQLSKVNLK